MQRYVFPKLRELCEQNEARFQSIDLRWGPSEEAALDQQTMNTCMEELGLCQRLTPPPNFILLLGDRYGWIPLPPQVPATEFDVDNARLARLATERLVLAVLFILVFPCPQGRVMASEVRTSKASF